MNQNKTDLEQFDDNYKDRQAEIKQFESLVLPQVVAQMTSSYAIGADRV